LFLQGLKIIEIIINALSCNISSMTRVRRSRFNIVTLSKAQADPGMLPEKPSGRVFSECFNQEQVKKCQKT